MSKTPPKDSDAQLDLGLGGPGALAPARPAAAPEPPKPAAPAAAAHPSLPAPKITGPLKNLVDVNFLQYASYVIKDRAIPDLADGLKPVQRRILWSLHEKDDGKFIKVANISGYCMQYHPHGDASINDALVTLANKQYLIEGQGNFGNLLTGDSAAAPRYIECRLTELARKELFNDALTEFVPSYDGRSKEPVTLPCKIPLLLMLGADWAIPNASVKIPVDQAAGSGAGPNGAKRRENRPPCAPSKVYRSARSGETSRERNRAPAMRRKKFASIACAGRARQAVGSVSSTRP